MKHHLRAVVVPPGMSDKDKIWHVVRDTDLNTAMCGRELPAEAETLGEDAWGTGLRTCQQCGSLYMHEAPHLEGDRY